MVHYHICFIFYEVVGEHEVDVALDFGVAAEVLMVALIIIITIIMIIRMIITVIMEIMIIIIQRTDLGLVSRVTRVRFSPPAFDSPCRTVKTLSALT